MKNRRPYNWVEPAPGTTLYVPEYLNIREIRKMPKVDLHNHLDGAVPGDLIWDVSQKYGVSIPGIESGDREAFDAMYPNPGPFNFSDSDDVNTFLRLFETSLRMMQTPKMIYDVAYGVLKKQAKENVFYTELRFAPNYHTKGGYPYGEYPFENDAYGNDVERMEENARAVLDAMHLAQRKLGIRSKLIFCIPRELAKKMKTGEYKGPGPMDIVDLALKLQYEGVAGIDLACNEYDGTDPYIECFRRTWGTALRRTVHADENPGCEENVHTALYKMGADRLGHALDLEYLPDDLAFIKKNNIVIERNPISNESTGLSSVNYNDYAGLLRDGVKMTINSDDCGVFGPECNISENIRALVRDCLLTTQEVVQSQLNAIEGAFVDNRYERELLQAIFRNRFMDVFRNY